MRLAILLCVFLLATPVFAAYRPTGCDLSIKWMPATTQLGYCNLCDDQGPTAPPRPCSQDERQMKQSALLDATELVVQALCDLVPYECHIAYTSSYLNATYGKLLWPYDARSIVPSGVRYIGTAGDHYSKEVYTLRLFRKAIMSGSKTYIDPFGVKQYVRPAAKLRLANAPTLRAVLNVDSSLVGENPNVQFKIDQNNPPDIPSTIANLAPLDSRPENNAKQKALVNRPADMAALHAIHCAHAATTCLPMPLDCAEVGDVSGSVKAYEGLCGSDHTCLQYRQLPIFHGGCDRRWSAAECCQWKNITHVFMERWVAKQVAGDMAFQREAGQDHDNAHTCMNGGGNTDPDEGPKVIFSCKEYPHDVLPCVGPNGIRGPNTCRAFLPFLVQKLGL